MQTMNGFVPLFSAAADAIKNNNGNGNGKATQQQQTQQQQAGKFNNRRKRPFPQVSSRKLVPFTEVEWKYVQRKFMSEDPANLKQICDIMNMWINRMGNDTPVFVNISDLVLRALALEGKQPSVAAAGRASSSTSSRQEDRCSFAQQSHHQLDNADLGLIYGSVIIRFVNYVNEICQPERAPLVPIATAVSKMQIPTWVVNLRHQATHAQMPSMNLMKEAIKFCRTWLWQKHWSKPLTDAIKQTLPEIYEQQQEQQKNTLDNRIVNALRRFREWRRRFPTYTEFSWPTYAQQPSKSKRGSGSGQKNFHDQLRETIQTLLDSNPEEFISTFSLTCLSHGTSDSEQEIFAQDPNGPAGHLLRGTLFSRENHIDTISGHEQQCYAPIFELMNAKGLLPSALLGITRLIASAHPSFAQRCHLAGWANKMLAAYLETPTKISTQNWRSILRHFVMAAQFFREENIKSLIEFLNENESINEKWRKKLETLLKIRHIGNSELENQQRGSNNKQNNEHLSISTMSASSQQSVKTLADLQSKLRHEDEAENTFLRDPLTMESDWSLANADELGTVLGLTADQKADTLCLALDCDFYTA